MGISYKTTLLKVQVGTTSINDRELSHFFSYLNDNSKRKRRWFHNRQNETLHRRGGLGQKSDPGVTVRLNASYVSTSQWLTWK